MYNLALLKRVYDINLNYLGVNPPPRPSQEGKSGRPPQEERKKKKARVEGKSFLLALLSGHDTIPQISNPYNIYTKYRTKSENQKTLPNPSRFDIN
ncbi:MAG: hypothetical protein F6K24_42335 [Okeania sp. SIO2D1]|nr:hypothetical protein [Okeania sp. SIO2D1]